MQNPQMIASRIKQLAKDNNISIGRLCKECGLGVNYINQMSNKTSVSREKIEIIANYFSVSVEYLLGEPQNNNQMIELPILGEVSAGYGKYADNEIIGTQYVPLNWLSGNEPHVLLRVKGDSMFPKFEEGDLALVRCQESVDSGSYAVALIDGDNGVIKRVVYGSNWIELQSLNHMYSPRRFEDEDVTRVRIFGLVRKIIKDTDTH